MKLSELISTLDYTLLKGNIERYIETLTSDSRKAKENAAFVCIKGAVSDGHTFLKTVIRKGAAAVIVQDDCCPDKSIFEAADITVIVVKDTRIALAFMSAAFFGNPADKLFKIGITGTKGKTTTSYMIKNVLEACGIKTGLIGTIETIIGDESFKSENTTPESYQIHKSFRKMVDCGCKAAVMEVSSQGLKLNRTAGIYFDIGVFTNLSPDHIGPNEHKSFEEYLLCKSRLFRQCRIGIVNADDKYTKDIIKNCTCELETYGLSESANIRAENIKLKNIQGSIGLTYECKGFTDMHVELSMPGRFSVYNSLCAIAVTRYLKAKQDVLKKVLKQVKVKGRIEIVPVSYGYTLIIDYAHNAAALKNVLETLKEYNPVRLICLFGCGGNRDRNRRFQMGEISGKLADLTVITSDNPRDEEPLQIIEDIKSGISKTNGRYIEIADRGAAIEYVLKNAEVGDIILLAGKGHEDYQEIRGVKYHMDEREMIADIIKR